MNGKERIYAIMNHKPVDAVPWVPFAGVHAGQLRGYNAQEVLSDPDKLLESLLEVNRLYDPDGQPVLFDLQLEAEILGCELLWPKRRRHRSCPIHCIPRWRFLKSCRPSWTGGCRWF